MAIYESIKNVKEFGAIGDGVADDTSAIQELINSAEEGSVIYFPQGEYKITETIVLRDKMKYLGESWLSRIVRDQSFKAGTPMLHLKAKANTSEKNEKFWIDSLEIDGNKKDEVMVEGDDGIRFEGVFTAFFDRLHIIDCAGTGINTTSYVLNNTIHIRNCFFHNNSQHGLLVHGYTSDLHVLQCDIGASGLANINFKGVSSSIRQSTIWFSKKDVGIECSGDALQIEGCQIEGNSRHAIYFKDSSHCSVQSNKIYASISSGSRGIYIGAYTKTVENIFIGNNMIFASIVDGWSNFEKAITIGENHKNIKVLANNLSYLGVREEVKESRPYVEGLKLSKGDQWSNIDDTHYVKAGPQESLTSVANSYLTLPLEKVQSDLSDLIGEDHKIHIREDRIYTIGGSVLLGSIDPTSSFALRMVIENRNKTVTLAYFSANEIVPTIHLSSQELLEAGDIVSFDFVSTKSSTIVYANSFFTLT